MRLGYGDRVGSRWKRRAAAGVLGALVVGAGAVGAADSAATSSSNATSPDGIAPKVRFTDLPKRETYSRRATFRFETDDPDGWTYCYLDHHGNSGRTCTSPHTVRHLNPGWHTMIISAVDANGNNNGYTRRFNWKVKRKDGVRYRPKLTRCGRVNDPLDEAHPLILAHKVECPEARRAARYWFGRGPRPAGWGCWSSFNRCYKGGLGSSQWITTKSNRASRRP